MRLRPRGRKPVGQLLSRPSGRPAQQLRLSFLHRACAQSTISANFKAVLHHSHSSGKHLAPSSPSGTLDLLIWYTANNDWKAKGVSVMPALD
ncbi:hypothetical protein CBM2598_U10314 [Cupriavidus taiwanensis]|nr:hypothetical protein CBM2598_U10314 [Cupriavidus taiwanensis]